MTVAHWCSLALSCAIKNEISKVVGSHTQVESQFQMATFSYLSDEETVVLTLETYADCTDILALMRVDCNIARLHAVRIPLIEAQSPVMRTLIPMPNSVRLENRSIPTKPDGKKNDPLCVNNSLFYVQWTSVYDIFKDDKIIARLTPRRELEVTLY